MKIVTIVGARPQFIKAGSVSRAIQKHNKGHEAQITEVMVHTGQHYDEKMSQVFFDELEIRKPDYNLGVGSGTHGQMTGAMLEKIEEVLLQEKPAVVLVYGDTNSTLAGALAASKLHILVGHVEAGLRSFNRQMPEEINRVLTDHVSTFLFCPTDTAVKNLRKEGITEGVFKVGDVMFDSFVFNKQLAEKKSIILSELGLKPKGYCLVTVHREENTTNGKRLGGIFEAFNKLATQDCPFIAPLHPRTAKALNELGRDRLCGPHVRLLEPVSYLDMVLLETHAKVILTDSGGVQKEACFAETPCITLRNETEWVELVEHGYNVIAGSSPERICRAFGDMVGRSVSSKRELYGRGRSSEKIVSIINSTDN
jgi:UDP-N-acetylglucosamine 2-epimerase